MMWLCILCWKSRSSMHHIPHLIFFLPFFFLFPSIFQFPFPIISLSLSLSSLPTHRSSRCCRCHLYIHKNYVEIKAQNFKVMILFYFLFSLEFCWQPSDFVSFPFVEFQVTLNYEIVADILCNFWSRCRNFHVRLLGTFRAIHGCCILYSSLSFIFVWYSRKWKKFNIYNIWLFCSQLKIVVDPSKV